VRENRELSSLTELPCHLKEQEVRLKIEIAQVLSRKQKKSLVPSCLVDWTKAEKIFCEHCREQSFGTLESADVKAETQN
jgi:hypothetical protein